MQFEVLGEISEIETFATGAGIREIARLRIIYGRGRWRKRKGIARVRLTNGTRHLAEYTGTKPPELVGKNSRSSICCEGLKMPKPVTRQPVVCINSADDPASLERRKIYITLRDAAAEKQGLVRIVDESGDDYLYPKALFRTIALLQSVKKAALAA